MIIRIVNPRNFHFYSFFFCLDANQGFSNNVAGKFKIFQTEDSAELKEAKNQVCIFSAKNLQNDFPIVTRAARLAGSTFRIAPFLQRANPSLILYAKIMMTLKFHVLYLA